VTGGRRPLRVLALPKGGIPYNDSLYAALEARGVEVRDGVFAGRWLLDHARGCDCVHIHWPSFFYAIPGASPPRLLLAFARFVALFTLMRMMGLRVLWTAHNLYPHDRCGLPVLDALARRFVIAIATTVFVHGPTAAGILEAEFPSVRGKTRIIEHGNWIGRYPNTIRRAEARDRLGLSDEFVYLFVGLCKEYKNLHGLIEGFAGCPASSRLVIAGKFQSADYQRRIEALIRATAPDRIRLEARFVPDDELQVFLVACDVVTLPYLESLTSGAAMLALSFGRPVVAPRRGQLVDVIDATCGLLYEREQPDALAGALAAVAERRYDESVILRRATSFRWDSAADAVVEAIAGASRR
jgi:beta-1,4-mannosyltransferase